MSASINIDVAALDPAHRQAMEDLIGSQLRANQRISIQVSTLDEAPAIDAKPPVMDLIAHFYDGMSDAEIEEIDRAIKTRANLA